MEFLSRVMASLIAGLLVALLIGLVARVWLKDDIHRWLVARDPTCAEPGALVPVDVSRLEVTESAGDPSARVAEGGGSPEDAIDGYTGSWWVPDLESPRLNPQDKHTWHVARMATASEARTLTVVLPEKMDVRLVCVVSGLPESETRYRMHGSVRELAVWGSSSSESPTTLQRLGAERMSYYQDAGGESIGSTVEVHLRVDSVFSGQTVETFDPDDCLPPRPAAEYRMEVLADEETPQRRFAPGCIRAPVPAAGLAEVMIYVRE